jgi:hypothetical protein
MAGKGEFQSPLSPDNQCTSPRGDAAQCCCALPAGSWGRSSERAEAVHGARLQSVAVPSGLEAMATAHPGNTAAMAAAVAGEEAGPEGEDPMLENSVVFLYFFFHLPSVGTCINCGTVFSFFFSTQNKGKRFFGLPKK